MSGIGTTCVLKVAGDFVSFEAETIRYVVSGIMELLACPAEADS